MPDESIPGPTPTGYQRTQGGGVKWQPPTAEHLSKLLPQYDIECILGYGGMGAVYKGKQKSLDRTVAIKILPPEVDDEDASYVERFKNEAKVMAKFMHPAIVGVFDFGETSEGQLFIVMEFVDGTDVQKMLHAQGRLPSEHALAITAHVCDALAYAHKHGVIHRDIKPANILINMEGAVKVADFGLAKAEEAGASGITKTGMAMGTPDYVAPETLVMGVNVDGRADLYAVGVMLYAMLTGNVPRGAFKPVSVMLPGTDPRFDKIVQKAMQMDREERYQSAAEIRRDLDVILTTPLVQAGGQSSAAIPKAAVAQKPVAKGPQKPIGKSANVPVRQGGADTPVRNQTPGGPAAKMNEAEKLGSREANLRAPLPPAKSSLGWIIPAAVSAVVILGGAFLMKGKTVVVTPAGEEEPAKPKAVASASTTPIKVREETKPVGDDVRSLTSKPGTTSTEPTGTAQKSLVTSAPTAAAAPLSTPALVLRWQRVEQTDARWKELGFEVKDGWVSFLSSPGVSQKAWVISHDIKGKVPRDVAVRVRFRKEKIGHVSLNCRYDTTKPMPEALFWSDGRFQFRIQNRSDGTPAIQEGKLPAPPAIGDEGILELAAVGSRVIARVNSTIVLEQEVSGMSPAGPFEVRSGGHWIKDAEYMDLDGVADPLKELGWNVSARSPASTSTNAASAPATPPKPSTPSPAAAAIMPAPPPPLPASSSPPPPASELDKRLSALESGFQAAVERDANAAFKASMAALDKLYLGALDRALATASKGGKLEEAIALREEKQRIEKGEGVPSEVDESTQAPGKVPDTLKTLRKTYRSTTAQHEATKAKAMQPLYDKYDQALAAVQTELTQAQKLDDAMRVKTVREQIAAARSGGEGSAGTLARTTSTGGAAAQMTEADKSVRAPFNTSLLLATKDKPFTNSLGMKFVPVPDTEILMCIHETRYKDYAAYAGENSGVEGAWKNQACNGYDITERNEEHPVHSVNWDDAKKFCGWLSARDGLTYRLPTDEEWSNAVGIGRRETRRKDTTPLKLNQGVSDEFPWGSKWPPSESIGNYSDNSRKAKAPSGGDSQYLEGYDDGFPTTAPVMTWKPNKLGLYDLGGNVLEWCDDWYDESKTRRLLRGGSWVIWDHGSMLSSTRWPHPPDFRTSQFGIRVVIETKPQATKPATPTPAPPVAPPPTPATASKSDFTNSLGMKFVKVPGTKVLFCIHETRKGDYAKYAAETPEVDLAWRNPDEIGIPVSAGDDHPVVRVSWNSAKAFCAWLSKKEGRTYRLPTDREWSFAGGIGRNEKEGPTPANLVNKVEGYPWGDDWPPPKDGGNLADITLKNALPSKDAMSDYNDLFPTTAPVMSFKPNKLGIFDLSGNVWELCGDWYDEKQASHPTRGAAWNTPIEGMLRTAFRAYALPGHESTSLGFRVVLETTDK